MPIVLALFVGFGNERSGDISLLICDSQGNTVRSLSATNATDSGKGYCVFRFDPRTLPNPVLLRWSTPDGEDDLAGPCDPMQLSSLLLNLEYVAADPLVEPEGQDTQDTSASADDSSDADIGTWTPLSGAPWPWS